MTISSTSSAFRPGVVTSTNRPVTPYEGQVIYETDTNRVLVWDNAAWVMIADTDQPPGLQLVKTQTIGTAVSSVDVTSCFSADYDNYLVMFSNVAASTSTDVFQAKLLSGTTPVTSGVYGNTFYIGNSAAGGLTNAPFVNTAHAEVGSKDATSTNHGKFDVLGPFLASYTRFNYFDTDDNYLRWHSSIHRVATSYDGIQFLVSSGTMTGGTVRVYGYRNS